MEIAAQDLADIRQPLLHYQSVSRQTLICQAPSPILNVVASPSQMPSDDLQTEMGLGPALAICF